MRCHGIDVRKLFCLSLVGLALLCSPVVHAQDPAIGEEAIGEEVEPRYPGDEYYIPAEPGPTALSNPAVRAILGTPRETASDYLRATRLLLKLGEADLAAGEFHRLLVIEPDEPTRLDLVEEFGPAVIQELARATALGPKARTFAESLLAASRAAARSTERVNKLLEQLASNDQLERNKAVATLAGTGDVAVVPLIQLLAGDQAAENQKQAARAALIRLGPIAERPLMATLDSGDAKLVAEAAELLAAIRSADAAPLMAWPALGGGSPARAYQSLTGQQPSAESAIGLIERTLKTLEGGAPVFAPDAEGFVSYWVWSEDQPLSAQMKAAEANTLYTARLTSALAKIRGAIPSIQSKALRLDYEANEILARYGFAEPASTQPLDELSASTLNRMLTEALEENQAAAARMALQVIAERKDPGMLLTEDSLPSPTANALLSSHPSVRLAALETIAAIDPPKPFPGSSKVCPAIVELATARGERLALAAAPRIDAAATLAGRLASQGIVSEVANTGEQLFEKANMLADVELILIDMNLNHPGVRDVVYQLRVNPSTALVPIALVARESQFARARTIASEHVHVTAFLRPHSTESMRSLVNAMLIELPASWPTASQRLDQRERAKVVMNKLLENDRSFYRLRAASKMLSQSVLPPSDVTWQLLSQLGTRDSQLAMLSHASAATADIESRRAAAKAFTDSVNRFGIRITADEIILQYRLYNASANDTPESQQVLASILDTIEQGKQKPQDE